MNNTSPGVQVTTRPSCPNKHIDNNREKMSRNRKIQPINKREIRWMKVATLKWVFKKNGGGAL